MQKMPILIVIDVMLSVGAVYAGFILRFNTFRTFEDPAPFTVVTLFPFALVVIISSFLLEPYDDKR
jgi:hypothetical protein